MVEINRDTNRYWRAVPCVVFDWCCTVHFTLNGPRPLLSLLNLRVSSFDVKRLELFFADFSPSSLFISSPLCIACFAFCEKDKGDVRFLLEIFMQELQYPFFTEWIEHEALPPIPRTQHGHGASRCDSHQYTESEVSRILQWEIKGGMDSAHETTPNREI